MYKSRRHKLNLTLIDISKGARHKAEIYNRGFVKNLVYNAPESLSKNRIFSSFTLKLEFNIFMVVVRSLVIYNLS